MDMYIDAGLGDRDPYWVEPWPSAFFLAAELAARPELVAGKAVAELGCGIGLGGAAAAASGAPRGRGPERGGALERKQHACVLPA
jgi:predicted nicotinamide N-methyase